MKDIKYFIIALFAIGMVCSCKTSEANYRAAYEKAVAARDSSDRLEETIYGKMRKQGATRTVDTGAGEAEVKTMPVKVTEGGGGENENLRRYNVVAGQFKQKFNALSLRDRLAGDGYPDAFVVETAEPYYYICVGSYSGLEEAANALVSLRDANLKGVKEPCPFILDATARRASVKAE